VSRGSSRRLGFRLEYDGTEFHGWQAQTGQRTVQGTLVDVLRTAFDPEATVDGASRTDAGVHARDQLAAATLAHPITASGFVKALNARLPRDVAVRCAWDAPADFQPRFSTRGKTYVYRLYRDPAPRPLIDRQAWRIGFDLDCAAMAAAAEPLLGTHDFAAYAASDAGQTSTVRTLYRLGVDATSDAQVVLTVEGSAFLKQMVRNLVGTLVEIGRGHWPVERAAEVLAGRDRRRAGPTAPGRGLTLEKVWFETPVTRDEPVPDVRS
jgi:tRNA pseudouridine38-40 synthase